MMARGMTIVHDLSSTTVITLVLCVHLLQPSQYFSIQVEHQSTTDVTNTIPFTKSFIWVALLLCLAPSLLERVIEWFMRRYRKKGDCMTYRHICSHLVYAQCKLSQTCTHMLFTASTATRQTYSKAFLATSDVLWRFIYVLSVASTVLQTHNYILEVGKAGVFGMGDFVHHHVTKVSQKVVDVFYALSDLKRATDIFYKLPVLIKDTAYQHLKSFATTQDVPYRSLICGKDLFDQEGSGETEEEIWKLYIIDKTEEASDAIRKRRIHDKRKLTSRHKHSGNAKQSHHGKTKQCLCSCMLMMFRIFERAAASTLQLMQGKCLKVSTCKKALFFLVLIMSGLEVAETAMVPDKENTAIRGLIEYKLLLTTQCHYRDIIHSSTCDYSDERKQTYIDYCEFAKLCDPGYKPVCVDSVDGMLHICSPVDLTCPKGYRRRAWLNHTNSNIVLVQEEVCPENRYQIYESNCYDACLNKQPDINLLPTQYAIYSMGNITSPPWIYCDFEKGFYNRDGKTLIMYDSKTKHRFNFCVNTADENPCTGGQYPLPNGTCVGSCVNGMKRLAQDDFRCTGGSMEETSREEEISSSKGAFPEGNLTTEETNKEREISTTRTTTQAVSPQHKPDNIKIILIITGVCVMVLLGVLICCVIVHCRHQNICTTRRHLRISNKNKTEFKTSFHDKVGTVVIHNHAGNYDPEDVTQAMLVVAEAESTTASYDSENMDTVSSVDDEM